MNSCKTLKFMRLDRGCFYLYPAAVALPWCAPRCSLCINDKMVEIPRDFGARGKFYQCVARSSAEAGEIFKGIIRTVLRGTISYVDLWLSGNGVIELQVCNPQLYGYSS